jgi:hypothetical protein
MIKIKEKEDIIEIQEEVTIPQEDQNIILEKGDKIKILNEGASTFSVISQGRSMKDAYRKAVDEARMMAGNDPYNGTISTTQGFRPITGAPNNNPNSNEFREWVSESDSLAEKWGPALGVDLGGGKYFFFGWAAC